MATGYRLARVRGVDVRLDPSWIVGFALITWGLAGALLAVHPAWGRALTLLAGAIAALSLFAAVVAHQAAEATMARAWGVSVRDITLHVFGGAARLTREPPTPRAELWMAIVGPIVSVTLGLVALGAGALLVSLSAPARLPLTELVQHIGPVPTALFSLAAACFFVGLFNLLPGLPLDGGRIVRAVSWASSGDFQRATRIAAEAGRALGWTLTAAGLVVALGGELVAGLAIALLGWLVRAAAEGLRTLRVSYPAAQSWSRSSQNVAIAGHRPFAAFLETTAPTWPPCKWRRCLSVEPAMSMITAPLCQGTMASCSKVTVRSGQRMFSSFAGWPEREKVPLTNASPR
ncbi:MAG: site-2 protease family protein [Myxococcales bacterium]|nr:site-2 protease family protein [Myxococcales bacterium]